jgi:glutaconate CoA-transferase subunit A
MPPRSACPSPGIAEFEAQFTGEKLQAVRAISPDVTIVQAQRADASGNAHVWGNLGVLPDAVNAARRVIVVAEEIVAPKAIESDPNRTVVPGFLVAAVAHVPFGGHPSPVQGHYNRDHDYYREYHQATKTRAQFEAWLEQWVTGLRNREDYLGRLGKSRIESLKVRKHSWSARADFGS